MRNINCLYFRQEIQKDLLIELLKEYIRRNDKNESSSKENTSL